MQNNALLTQDELDFIQKMQHVPQLNVREATLSLLFEGGVQIRDLLTKLIAHEQVTVQARFENQQMSFPLQVVEDEFHASHLQLGVPSIYETGPMIRPWRLTLQVPVALENAKGQATAFWLQEISFKGVLLAIRSQVKPPKHFTLWFKPEGHERIALHGSRVRITEQGLAAYQLSQSHPKETERLRQYILQQHRLTHPELHA